MKQERQSCLRVLVVLSAAGLFAASSSLAATFTVSNTGDSGPGSLRQAILDANATPGADTIAFAIVGPGVHTISPLSVLPALTDDAGATIDGYTQPGSSANTLAIGGNAILRIELDGAALGLREFGLTLRSSSNLVRGLVINGIGAIGTGGGAIRIDDGSNNVVSGCFLGTDATAMLAKPNEIGVSVAPMDEPAAAAAGAFARTGLPTGTRIGGATPAERNVISGNASVGVFLNGAGGSVMGNHIGTDASGTGAVANATGILVFFSAEGLTIGGTIPGSGNIISGNQFGILFFATLNGLIQGNRIGTDATGSRALPNASGIQMFQASGAVIGGDTPGAGNVISANSFQGIRLFNCPGSTVAGNLIGTAADAAAPLGNGQNGVLILATSTNNTVGGAGAGARNTIAFNGAAGVAIDLVASNVSHGNRVLGNAIHDNAGLGVDLGGDGVAQNDPGDGDTGPNNLQNFPLLTGALVSSVTGRIVVKASQDSNPVSGSNAIQFFLADDDPSGHGEGKKLLLDVSGLPAGFASVETPSFAPPSPVSAGDLLTATATTTDGTSEFSQNLAFAANRTPIADSGANQGGLVGSTVTLDGSGSTDPDGLPKGPSIQDGFFHWTQTAGPAATLLNAGSAAPTFTPAVPGTYQFSLVVSDGLDLSTNSATVTVVVIGRLTALSPARIWIGLKNSDDAGTRFDLKAEVLRNGSVIGSGQVNNVPGGGSGFNKALLNTVALTLLAPVDLVPGDTLSIRLSVRAGATGHRSGTARLWFNDAAANSRFDVVTGGIAIDFYLSDGFILGTAPGPGPRKTMDVFVDRAAGGNAFKPFGTWSIAF